MNHNAIRRNGTWKSDPGFIYGRRTNQYPPDHRADLDESDRMTCFGAPDLRLCRDD